MARWSADLRIIEGRRASVSSKRPQDHLANQAAVRQAHTEPVERAFVSILSSSDCSLIAATLIQDNKNKDLAESALTLFKQKLGPKLSKEMLGIWNDPDIRDYRNQAHQRYVLPLTSNHGKRSSISLRPNVFSSECSWTRGQEISLARNSSLVDHFSETAGRDLHSTILNFCTSNPLEPSKMFHARLQNLEMHFPYNRIRQQ